MVRKKGRAGTKVKPVKKIKAYFCPQCGSVRVYHPMGVTNLFGIIPGWKCKDCGFKAMMFPLGIVDADKLNKKKKGGAARRTPKLRSKGAKK
ncbi:hypothetical protein HOA55_04290 [archaeon]|jgi:predicted RNA-binding Zn-ribbon protein involved in translation (DUF1610 family)|nr:hypothetical protein [archaeon]MBT3577945.1 hypothetical protein [archaeon]MBT6820548.1 hypothetical protein [archaeon]MBT6956086.1 hypothetical protein [archaeon]MBT7025799.1 hypothetical protein [archaeon]